MRVCIFFFVIFNSFRNVLNGKALLSLSDNPSIHLEVKRNFLRCSTFVFNYTHLNIIYRCIFTEFCVFVLQFFVRLFCRCIKFNAKSYDLSSTERFSPLLYNSTTLYNNVCLQLWVSFSMFTARLIKKGYIIITFTISNFNFVLKDHTQINASMQNIML